MVKTKQHINRLKDTTTTLKTPKELMSFATSFEFDPNLDEYYHLLLKKVKSINTFTLCSQYKYYYDFYKQETIFPNNNNICKLLGYEVEEFYHLMLYENIHPADRLIIYKATAKTVDISRQLKYKDTTAATFLMDYRIKKKNGEYIRVLRETDCLLTDKLGNMVFSYAFYTDITAIKTSNKIGFDFKGSLEGVVFPDDELLINKNIFSKRESDVLQLLAKGDSSKEIAEKLFISKNTVDTHRRKMLKKAMLKNTSELVVFGLETGTI